MLLSKLKFWSPLLILYGIYLKDGMILTQICKACLVTVESFDTHAVKRKADILRACVKSQRLFKGRYSISWSLEEPELYKSMEFQNLH